MLCVVFAFIYNIPSSLAIQDRRSRQQVAPVLVRDLWNELEKDSNEAKEIDTLGTPKERVGPNRHQMERVTMSSGGSLLRSEREETQKRGQMTGGNFDGVKAFSNQLPELRRRCPGAFSPGWKLVDFAEDANEGQHWVLQGPAAKGAERTLRVSAERKVDGGSAPLRLSPIKLCQEISASLLEVHYYSYEVQGDEEKGGDMLDGMTPVPLTNQFVVDAHAWAEAEIVSITAQTCADNEKVANVVLESATLGGDDGIDVCMRVRMDAVAASVVPTEHHFCTIWKPDNGVTIRHIEFPLKLDPATKTRSPIGWCEFMTASTVEDGELLALRQTYGAPEKRTRNDGLLDLDQEHQKTEEPPDPLYEKAESAHVVQSCQGFDSVEFDPRTRFPDCVGPETVEDQGKGSCSASWAFAPLQSLAIRACLEDPISMRREHSGTRIHFSKQAILSCNTKKYGCNGGNLEAAFKEARKGLIDETDYPFYPGGEDAFPWSGECEYCQWGMHPKPFIATRIYKLVGSSTHCSGGMCAASVEDIKKELYCKGPLAAVFQIKTNFFSFFQETPRGVYTKAHCDMPEPDNINVDAHATTLIGYGSQDSTDFWLLMNSWGRNWADEGFFRFERGTDTCHLESLSMMAGDVKPTGGSWMYKDWEDQATGEKTRGIECRANFGNTAQQDDTCPNSDGSFWPDKVNFPDSDSTEYQEIEAIRGQDDTGSACTVGVCNGRGSQQWQNSVLTCFCDDGYAGTDCGECDAEHEGYPACREKCTTADCPSGRPASGGVKWTTQVNGHSMEMNNCECDCDNTNYAGLFCDRCSNSSYTYPHCTAELHAAHLATGTTSGPETTTTTPAPCRVNRGPIELMPPAGKHWIVLDCDVRHPDCEPDHDKCLGSIYSQYCQWKVTQSFPTGQCLNKNASMYHAKIEGTERSGESMNNTDVDDVNKTNGVVR